MFPAVSVCNVEAIQPTKYLTSKYQDNKISFQYGMLEGFQNKILILHILSAT